MITEAEKRSWLRGYLRRAGRTRRSPELTKASVPLFKEYEERAKRLKDPKQREALRKEIQDRMPKVRVTIADVANHVDHVRKVAGVEHVGLGGDYDGNDSWPEGLEDVSGYPRLLAELARRGWSDEDLKRFMAGDHELVIKRVVRRARAPLKGKASVEYDPDSIRRDLSEMSTREEGLEYLANLGLNRDSLQKLAADLDVPVTRSESVDRLRNRIVEAFIGYRLRSSAVRGTDRRRSTSATEQGQDLRDQ